MASYPIQAVPVHTALGMKPRNYKSDHLSQEQLNALTAKHSIANLFTEWAKDPKAVRARGIQLALHRLLFDPSRGIPDNSDLAHNALIEAGAKIGERDINKTEDDEFISAHPQETKRFMEGANFKIGAVRALELLGRAHKIAQVFGGEFTGEGHLTGEVIDTAANQIRRAVSHDGYNEIEDARDANGADIIPYAWDNLKSQLPALMFQNYPYVHRTYDDLSKRVKEIKVLPTGWQSQFNMASCVTAETLLMFANLHAAQAGTNADTSVANLEAILEAHYAPWISKRWNVFAANLGISSAGDWLHDDEKGATHPSGYVFKEPGIIETIKAVRAINNYNDRLRSMHPKVMRIAMARTADYFDDDGKPFFFSIMSGEPTPWPEVGTEKRYLVEASADIHYPMKHTDILMTDQPIECLELLADKA
ncbi:hypothetical protein C6558_32295 [Ensifer sp. NM-2]|nr:hypothetical protein C6558_32295 [Ensifer sp. NM-2]